MCAKVCAVTGVPKSVCVFAHGIYREYVRPDRTAGHKPQGGIDMSSGIKNSALALAIALMLAICPVCACAEAAEPVEVIDALGRSVAIDAVPEKIVSLAPSNTEILFALGVGDKVIGVDEYSDYPAEAAAIENKVGGYAGPNVELILSLEPDIVFADDNLQQEAIDSLESLGVKVVAVSGANYADVSSAIELVAKCVGADTTQLFADMKATEDKALAMVDPEKTQSAYFALSFGAYGDWTSATGTFVDDMMNMLGVKNVGAELGEGWMSISLEKLLEADPDVILVSGDEAMLEAFKADANYAALTAVKNGKVYAVDPDMSHRPGPRIVDALLEFAEIFYPAAETEQPAA